MTRGTTPTYVISFKETDFDFSAVTTWAVTLKQWKQTIHFDDPEVDVENRTLTVTLSQEETLSLQKGTAELQVRGVFGDGVAFASDIACVAVNPVIDERILA